MEYHSAQYKPVHNIMTVNMETVTINKETKGEKEQAIVPTISQKDWMSSTYGCERALLVPWLLIDWRREALYERVTDKSPKEEETQEDNRGIKESWYPLTDWAQITQ